MPLAVYLSGDKSACVHLLIILNLYSVTKVDVFEYISFRKMNAGLESVYKANVLQCNSYESYLFISC